MPTASQRCPCGQSALSAFGSISHAWRFPDVRSAPVDVFLARVTLALAVVEAGTVSFNIDAPITVLHSVGNEEPTAEDFEAFPAGQDFTMEVGDSALFPASTAGEVRNDGTEDAVILAAIIEPSNEGGATPVA